MASKVSLSPSDIRNLQDTYYGVRGWTTERRSQSLINKGLANGRRLTSEGIAARQSVLHSEVR